MSIVTKRLRLWNLRVLFVCAATPLAGCYISNPDYPQRWSALSEGTDPCADLAGTYSEIGDGADVLSGRQGHPLLTEYLHLLRFSYGDKPDSVHLAYDSDRVLRVTVLRRGDVLQETTYSADDGALSCGMPGARTHEFSGFIGGQRGEVIVGYAHETVHLHRAADGSLVAKYHSALLGMVFMIMPLGASYTHWARFPPAPSG